MSVSAISPITSFGSNATAWSIRSQALADNKQAIQPYEDHTLGRISGKRATEITNIGNAPSTDRVKKLASMLIEALGKTNSGEDVASLVGDIVKSIAELITIVMLIDMMLADITSN